jgi:nucleoside-diphosphate-sugar epimerase
MKNDRTILITGVTGNQGGAAAQALRGAGFRLRGLTRKPDSGWGRTGPRSPDDFIDVLRINSIRGCEGPS